MNAHQENPHPTAQLPTPVTVIGLGPMGRAMVRTLLAAGHEVTVWNRTASRADGVVSDGAKRATTPREAIEASPLTLLSLTDYPAMYDILTDATTALSGRTLVNLSSDTPDRSREAATWAAGHGAAFLTGGVMNPAPMVGTDAAYVYYSGDEGVLTRHRAALAVIGTPKYLGTDPGLAQLMYQAHLTVFLTALSGLMHATALLGTAGITAEQALPELFLTADTIGAMMTAGEDRPGAALDAGEHPGDLSTVTMMGATADHILETSATLGLDLALPRTILGHYRRAVEDGHGGDNWTRIIDGMRGPRVG
ncbi:MULTISPECIES: NAD(P)-dependent oxidoreductase [Streptomyces]|uniref:NAD(P)-dependent oxidoreductase n=1 Tax=Streptomyces TaxID=1883 RepID=UPI000CD59728|nr:MULTISPECIES: NAD(P)-binding domain-containing protein [Streptomyces]WJK66915.1 NAD(P)-binding domain-containing protein [Streptomyces albidoflavus]WST08460.1 NAD(P)-binding domain-containing protein [Streptomyces albidoflavus]WTC43639.1 NAD(P)-binding domain-containing protein [Streptomyces albidoflavus]